MGKGLVQNVDGLPYNTAMKYTVAKYYTPSGRCIQSVEYKSKSSLKGSKENLLSSLKEKTEEDKDLNFEEILDEDDEDEEIMIPVRKLIALQNYTLLHGLKIKIKKSSELKMADL